MKYFICSDVHGFYTELMTALNNAGFDINNENHVFVSCGDLLDRGREPKKCLEFVNSLPSNRKILIRGNHEDLIEELVYDGEPSMRDYTNGTVQTIYDCLDYTPNFEDYDIKHMISRFSKYQPYREYMSSLVNYAEIGDNIFVHGWIPCYVWDYGSGAENYEYMENWRNVYNWTLYTWINGMDAWHSGCVEPNKTIYCGHWHCRYGNEKFHGVEDCDTSFKDSGIVCLDARTVLSGFINVEVVEV